MKPVAMLGHIGLAKQLLLCFIGFLCCSCNM